EGELNGGNRPEGVVEQVTPVCGHIEHDPAAVFLAVVPRRALSRPPLSVALEHPVSEFAAHAEDAAEEAVVHQPLELADTGKEEFVLHDSMLHAATARRGRKLERLGRGGGDRLL